MKMATAKFTWFPPLFGLMNTRTGVIRVVGTAFMMNAFDSFSLVRCLMRTSFLRGVFRSDDLKLPLRGSLTIHDGGTIMFECAPEDSITRPTTNAKHIKMWASKKHTHTKMRDVNYTLWNWKWELFSWKKLFRWIYGGSAFSEHTKKNSNTHRMNIPLRCDQP